MNQKRKKMMIRRKIKNQRKKKLLPKLQIKLMMTI